MNVYDEDYAYTSRLDVCSWHQTDLRVKQPVSMIDMVFICIASFILLTTSPAFSATSISQHGVTINFSADHTVGQFCNGDWWVVGPVTITSTSPAFFSEESEGATMYRHGTMINPSPSDDSNTGYGTLTYHTYVQALNIEESLPYTVSAGSSVVKAICYTIADPPPSNSRIKSAIVLTVLAEAPPDGSFRPPYSGVDKVVQYNKSQLDYTQLKKLAPVASTPTFATMESYFQKVWLDHVPGHVAQRMHPDTNMPEYGASLHDQLNVGAIYLNLNYTDAEKEQLLVYYTQIGIDMFRLVSLNSMQWVADGGHSGGRKLPILLAGLVLGDSAMTAVAAKSGAYLNSGGYGPGNIPPDYIFFGEDQQTHYVTQLDVDITNGNHSIPWTPSGIELTSTAWNTYDHGAPYSKEDIGLPEYGIRHATHPGWNTKQWDTYKNYRRTADRPFSGTALAVHIMGIKTLWNHPALFDYADRYVAYTGQRRGWSNGDFTEEMWDTYRNNYPPIWRRTPRLFRNVRLPTEE